MKVRRMHNYPDLMEYKREQAKVKEVVRRAKRQHWRDFCDRIGRSTSIEEVWNMIRRMNGIRKEMEYPVLNEREVLAIENCDKAEMFCNTFIKVNSTANLTEEFKREREEVLREHPHLLEKREERDNIMDVPFGMTELKRALRRMRETTQSAII